MTKLGGPRLRDQPTYFEKPIFVGNIPHPCVVDPPIPKGLEKFSFYNTQISLGMYICAHL